MNLKILIGIILPAILVIIIASLGSLNTGFSVTESFVTEIESNVFIKDGVKLPIKIGQITIINDYFLSKRYQSPRLVACFIDEDDVKQAAEAGSLEYTEGDIDYNYELYPYVSDMISTQIKAKETKMIKLFLRPFENYDKDYDKIVIIKLENQGYRYYDLCSNLGQNTIQAAPSIMII